jgi:deoxyribodipyrimidine photo-lyase
MDLEHATPLALPPAGDVGAAEAFVRAELADLIHESDPTAVHASPRVRGGQMAADAKLAGLDLTGYAARRNEVWPPERRGASRVSPYVRHGLLPLALLWAVAGDAPPPDARRYRDELLWQEHARHLYARLGAATAEPLRHQLAVTAGGDGDLDPWGGSMACVDLAVDELETDGWLVNQTRMWLASHWTVRRGHDWRVGEDRFFRHLLDGSRAANRAGWQWTVGAATGRPYGFSRWQVERRAPGVCDGCELRDACPIEDWPDDPPVARVAEHPHLRHDPDPGVTAGPSTPVVTGSAELVWLTAESLGDADPALAAHPDLPVAFVFDAPLLARLRLSGTRLIFLVETLADLARRRELHVVRGDPVRALTGRRLAATYAPVPGWRRRAGALDVVATHPWPWLVTPHGGSVASFSAWRRAADRAGALP